MSQPSLKQIVEGALLAAGEPLTVDRLLSLFGDHDRPTTGEVRQALAELARDCEGRGTSLREVASGFRIQVDESVAPWVSRLWEERPGRYSRALLETLAIIAYRQPITRGEIEDIRGVSVSSSIMRTLQDRQWIRTVGHRDLPGRPAMIGTTRAFLDHFGLRSLQELPTLNELRDLDDAHPEPGLAFPRDDAARAGGAEE